MRCIRWGVVALAFGIVTVSDAQDKKNVNKLPDAVRTALDKAGELDVYSLDGETSDKDGWHGSKVLGKTTVKKAEAKKLAGALAKGVTEGNRGARCFIPRHGVRADYNGKTYDLVICFECGWVYIYTDKSDKPQVLMISDSPHKLLDTILSAAQVPLAKSEKPEKK